MGKRIAYFKPTNGKTLKESVASDYTQFRDWALARNKQTLIAYNERFISVDFELVLQENRVCKIEEWNQQSVDNLVLEYLLTYCDYGPGQGKFELVGPTMYTHRYGKSDKLINDSSDKELIKLWNYLTKGRSIKNNDPFISPGNEGYVIGFWDSGERGFLSQRLSKLNKARKNNQGIEYVLSVIEELKNDHLDLILDVEKPQDSTF